MTVRTFADLPITDAEIDADPRMIALRRKVAEERLALDQDVARRLYQLKITICSEHVPELLGNAEEVAVISSVL